MLTRLQISPMNGGQVRTTHKALQTTFLCGVGLQQPDEHADEKPNDPQDVPWRYKIAHPRQRHHRGQRHDSMGVREGGPLHLSDPTAVIAFVGLAGFRNHLPKSTPDSRTGA